MLARRLRAWRDGDLGLALGADEQHLAAASGGLLDEVEGAREQGHSLRQIDDMDAVAVAEDVRLHPRVPAMGLVAEMRSGLEQLLHRDDSGRHKFSPSGYALSGNEKSRPGSGHRYECFRLWNAAPPSRTSEVFQAIGGIMHKRLDTREQNRNIPLIPATCRAMAEQSVSGVVQPLARDKAMLAPFATLIFLATLWLIARLVAELAGDSGSRIAAALFGRLHRTEARIPAMRVRFSAPRPARPLRARQQWRAAA
jgi:hypothetical protein